jgi:hypothetical protein
MRWYARVVVLVGVVLVLGACDAAGRQGAAKVVSDRDWHGPDLFGGAAIVSKDVGGGVCTISGPATLRIDTAGAAVFLVRVSGVIVRDNNGECGVYGSDAVEYAFQGPAKVGDGGPIQFATCGSKADKQASGTAQVLPGGATAKGMTEIKASCTLNGELLYTVSASLDRLDPSK